MTWRWKDRSAVPGEFNFVVGSLGFAPAAANVTTTDDIGDGTAGTIDLSLYKLIAPTTGEMAGYEKKDERRSGRQAGRYYDVRVYEVPLNSTPALPLPGAYFPGETRGPRIIDGGVTTSPIFVKGQSGPTSLRITIVAGGPLYATSDGGGESFNYGL